MTEDAERAHHFVLKEPCGIRGYPYTMDILAVLAGSPDGASIESLPSQEELHSFIAATSNSGDYRVVGKLNVPFSSGVRYKWNYDSGLYFYPLFRWG
ncbi:hypothetical protein ACOME3_004215 [Neoechinorhynchus agilis]